MINHGYLAHHGIIGQKWGVRRYQNADGSYTEAGKKKRAKNASSYSQEQADRDTQVYSKGASKRIEKRVSSGGSLQGARSKEADRIASFRRASKISGGIAPVAAGLATGFAVTNAFTKDFGMEKTQALNVGMTAGAIAAKIAHNIAPMSVMALGGYSPLKRY